MTHCYRCGTETEETNKSLAICDNCNEETEEKETVTNWEEDY